MYSGAVVVYAQSRVMREVVSCGDWCRRGVDLGELGDAVPKNSGA